MEPVVELVRAGCDSLEVKVGEVHPSTVANAFRVSRCCRNAMSEVTVHRSYIIIQLDPQTVWLKQEFGRRCYFPDQSGLFHLDADVGDVVISLTVEGVPISQSQSTSVPCASPATNPSSSNRPYYKPTSWNKNKDAPSMSKWSKPR